MPVAQTEAKLRWEDGVPVSVAFNDPYYARSDGLAETRHVFLDGNNLSNRFASAQTFRIAELGFGTGLNFLTALTLWRKVARPGGVLKFTSFERFPVTPAERTRALACWPELDALRTEWQDGRLPDADLEVIHGDARDCLPRWQGAADAWFLDGFAPARNPEMWGPDLMQAVHEKTAPGGTFATYTAAGHVRRGLTAAGFTVAKVPGFATKREMLTGRRS